MGLHAFEGVPDHLAGYDNLPEARRPRAFGVRESWNMPVTHQSLALPRGSYFPGVDHYVLTLHLSGAEAHRDDGNRFKRAANSGAISLQVPGSGGAFSSDGVVEYAYYYFRNGLLTEAAEELSGHPVEEIRIDDFLGRRCANMERRMRSYLQRARDCDNPPTSIEMDSEAYLIATTLLRDFAEISEETSQTPPPAQRREVQRAIAYIDKNLSEALRLSRLSDVAGMSPYHFLRIFKAETGETPSNYLMRRRAEAAREMISAGRLSLAEIAVKAGFSSQSHMTRRVKQTFGKTPKQLR